MKYFSTLKKNIRISVAMIVKFLCMDVCNDIDIAWC